MGLVAGAQLNVSVVRLPSGGVAMSTAAHCHVPESAPLERSMQRKGWLSQGMQSSAGDMLKAAFNGG